MVWRCDLWKTEGCEGCIARHAVLVLPFFLGDASIARLIYLLVFIVLGISLIDAPLQSGGWRWDTGNVFGFVAFAGLLYLFIDVGRGARQKLHQHLSYGVFGVLLAHILWLWLSDKTLWFYMSWQGPHYMLAGWVAIVLLTAMVILALPATRRLWHINYTQFQRWHYWLSLAVIATSFWHMVGSGFYLSELEAVLYGLLILGVAVAHQRQWLSGTKLGVGSVLIPLSAFAFVVLKAVNA